MSPVVTLLTDFGTRDGYVAAMKGVLTAFAPGVTLQDASHDVPRGDVMAASLALERYWARYPAGTVHIVVVDPGVGTERRALAVEADGRFVVAPDNGVASRVMAGADRWRAVAIVPEASETPSLSTTFHGRDVFAPAAARLAVGRPIDALGTPLSEPVLIELPEPELREGKAVGCVIGVDRFGNLVTNIPGERAVAGAAVEIGGQRVELLTSYGFAPPGGLLAVVNSDGRLEVAVRDGSASERLGVRPGEPVRVLQSPSSQRRSDSER